MTFEKVINMEIEWFDKPENSSGTIGARLSANAATVRSLVGDALALVVQNAANMVSGLLIAFLANWQLSLIILALIPLIGLNGYIQMKFVKGFNADAKEKLIIYFINIMRTVLMSISSFTRPQVFFALSMAAIGISQSSSIAPDSTKAKSATASVSTILDRESKIDPSDDSGMTLEAVKGNIGFQHVSFRYPTRPDVQIFQDLCLAIHAGKILLDGIEIQRFQLRWLRQQMVLVSQESSLFNETIRANIAYGKERQATEAEIIASAELANAHKFISSLQKGYDTLVGEQGIQLSGG
ncbi:putative ABC transporter B family member 4 [Cocos nucifera]|uniref:Putative ABC transporter B family member 4 n=1 Tax=Cocos nucifera TaxID=13894 RepID=A0A8K0IXK3_COCNU|nr:putative ABC transporter B family member 4 [Cocos nucifera]